MASPLLNVDQFVAAGFERAQFAISSSGLPFNTASPPAQDAVVGMTILQGAKAANPTLGAAEILQITGDNGVRASIQFPSNANPQFDLSFTDMTGAFLNAIQGTTTIDLQSVYDFFTLNPGNPPQIDIALLLTTRGQSTEAGNEGTGYYSLLFPLCTAVLTQLPNMQTGPNEGTFGFSVNVNSVSKLPWGTALSQGTHGTTSASGFLFFSKGIPTFDVYRHDGTATSFTPTQTLNSNEQMIAWNDIDGTPVTLAVTPSSGDVTFTAQTADDYQLTMYEVA